MRVLCALSSSFLAMALAILLVSNSVDSTNPYINLSSPPASSPLSNVNSLLPAAKDHHNSAPSPSSYLNHNHLNTFMVVGNIYSHLSYNMMKNSYYLKNATVKVTCMAGDKEIIGYGKANINGKYNITIEGYNFAKYGRKGCKAKLIYSVPEGSPFKQTTDVQNSKTETELKVKSGTYNDVLFQSKSFGKKNENLSVNPQAPPTNPTAIAYYKLVLQWPTGVCSAKDITCKKSPWPQHFTIHGLWETLKVTASAHPSSEQFDSVKLKSLEKDLKHSWPTLLKKNTDEDFWKIEWEHHGVKSELGLVGYFQQTLDLYNKVGASLVKGLQAANIYPNGAKLYKLKDIEAALKSSSGSEGIVTCVQHKILKLQQIQEITFNFTPGFQQQPAIGGSPSCTNNLVRFPI